MANITFDFKPQMGDTNTRVRPGEANSFSEKGALYKGTNHMGKLLAYEPQRLYNFELQIVGLDSLYTADMPGTDSGENNGEGYYFSNASERILVACSSFSVPTTEFGTIEIPHYNNTTKYAGKVTFGDASLKVEQYIGAFTEQIMTTWARCVYDPRTQNIGYKHDYAKDMFVIEYDSKGGTPRVWKMENAWPSVLPGTDWDYASNERRQMTYTIKCDRCVPDYAIDTRTMSTVASANADVNSMTQSSFGSGVYSGAANYGASWTYDPATRSYKNTNTNETYISQNTIQ